MQRVLRWEVPVDDDWHDIGAGYVVEVAARDHRSSPGDLVEVWTLEDTADTNPGDSLSIPMRSVTVIGTGHPVPPDTEHVGSAIVPTFTTVSRRRDLDEQIVSMSGLVWHVFAKYDPQTERAQLAEGAQRLAKIREAKPRTLEDEATGLSYWLAAELGEHVDDQDGETLTDTVQRLIAARIAPDDADAVEITDWDDFLVGDIVVQNPAGIDENVTHDHAGRSDATPFLVRRGGTPSTPAPTTTEPNIGGYTRGLLVRIDSINLDDYQGRGAVVCTLDHDHGWRMWVRIGDNPHDMEQPALYVSPDDLRIP